MLEAEELCERIAFIKNGRILTLGTADELKKVANSATLEGAFLEFARK